MSYLFKKITFFKFFLIIILVFIFLFKINKNLNCQRIQSSSMKFDNNDRKFGIKVWIIMDNYYCNDLNEFTFPRNWGIYARINNKTVNCENKSVFMNNFEILEKAILNDIDKIGVFKRIPDDFRLWTDPYTLFIRNKTTIYGKVCSHLNHSMTIETYDFPMKDWRISFYVKGRIVPFNPNANVLLEKSTLWFFPILQDEKNVAASLEYLSRKSKIRTLDLRSKMVHKNFKYNRNKKINNNHKVSEFLESLTETEIVR